MRETNVFLGGCWYGSKVDARLAQSLVDFTTRAHQWGVNVTTVNYQDGMLDIARNRLLAEAIASGADWLLSVDADCSFVGQAEPLCRSLVAHQRSDVALVGAPVKQGNAEWNVLDMEEQRFGKGREFPSAGPFDCGSIGFGLVAFRCGWYASNWPRQDRAFVPFFQTVVYPDRKAKFGMGAWGEDFGHCRAIRDRGAHVVCDPRIRVKHHVVRPGHPWAADE
jgi:hypothetical protein